MKNTDISTNQTSSAYNLLPNVAPVFAIARHRINVDGNGVTTLVTFSKCPLKCKFCINPQCTDPKVANQFTPKQLFEKVKMDNIYFLATNGGITFGGGEPCLWSDFIAEFRTFAPDWKISVETSLHINRKHLEKLLPIVDEYIVDIKDLNPLIYQSYTGKKVEMVKRNLKWLAAQGKAGNTTIRIPLIPGFNNETDRISSVKELQDMGFSQFDLFDYVIKNQ